MLKAPCSWEEQLLLPLFRGAEAQATAWLVVAERTDAQRLLRWLTTTSNSGQAPFFVDAATGLGLVPSSDPVVVLHPPRGQISLCLPRSLAGYDPDYVVSQLVELGRPIGIHGPTPVLHDGVLIQGAGVGPGKLEQATPRSTFDLAIERLNSRVYRTNGEAVVSVCESILRFPLPPELQAVVEGILAEATTEVLSSQIEEDVDVRAVSSEYRARELFRVSGHLEEYARRRRGLKVDPQLDLFGPREDGQRPFSVPRQLLSRIRCSLLPLSFPMQGIPPRIGETRYSRSDTVSREKTIPLETIRGWLRQTSPLTLMPFASKTKSPSRPDQTRVEIKVMPEFLAAFEQNLTPTPTMLSDDSRVTTRRLTSSAKPIAAPLH